jgi:hypothetical protein
VHAERYASIGHRASGQRGQQQGKGQAIAFRGDQEDEHRHEGRDADDVAAGKG